MTCITKKLRSERGASMLLALLFLFFCITIGAVVLTAASVNAGRTARLRQEQQDYFTVQSAARLLRDDLQKLQFVGSYTKTNVTQVTSYPGMPDKVEHYGPYYEVLTLPDPAPNTDFFSLLKGDCQALYETSVPEKSPTFVPKTHTLSIGPRYMPRDKVTAKITLNNDYSITAVLQTEAGTNPMTLQLTANKPSVTSAIEYKYHNYGNIQTTYEITTYRTTVTLAPGVITKGAIS